MLRFAAFIVLVIVVAFSGGCSGAGALIYCLANDHDINRRCT